MSNNKINLVWPKLATNTQRILRLVIYSLGLIAIELVNLAGANYMIGYAASPSWGGPVSVMQLFSVSELACPCLQDKDDLMLEQKNLPTAITVITMVGAVKKVDMVSEKVHFACSLHSFHSRAQS